MNLNAMAALHSPTLPRVVLIDGRSGSGKTSLAALVAAELGADQLHLEDLYPGWDGLEAGSRAVAEVLRSGEYQAYNWEEERFAERRSLDPACPLVIEGCGAVTSRTVRAAREFAGREVLQGAVPVWSVWLECDEPVRKARALGRASDGAVFAPHWDHWASQEAVHIGAEWPIALVNEIRHTS